MYHNVYCSTISITRIWKQPRCPSTDEWIKKMWHIYTMEYYSAIKRNDIELFAEACIDLEAVIYSEVSQKEISRLLLGYFILVVLYVLMGSLNETILPI